MTTKKGDRRRRKLARMFKEQSGICYLCGIPMRLNLTKKRTRFDASIDHLIPECEGGTMANNNIKAAHKYCNNARGAGEKEKEKTFQDHIAFMREVLSCPKKRKVIGILDGL